VNDSVVEFKNALDRVPQVLLDSEDARVLVDAQTSAEVLSSIASSPVSIVLAGSTGVGKSYLFNDLIGLDASATGVLRPTTTSVVTAGAADPTSTDSARSYVYAPQAPDGMVIADTPAFETDSEALSTALGDAQVGVLVVSPARYGDARTRATWDAMRDLPVVIVVLNRQRGTALERGEILASVKDRFSINEVVVINESDGSAILQSRLELAVADLPRAGGRAAIARATAVGAGRHVAGAVTSAAIDFGQVQGAVQSVASPHISGRGLAVHESWHATQQVLLDQISHSVDALDRAIIELAANPLAERVLQSLEPWHEAPVKTALSDWRGDAADRFRSDATIRWRRSSAEQLLDQFSWKTGVNPSVEVPKRVDRVMGTRLTSAIRQVHEFLVSIANESLAQRLKAWNDEVEAIGSFMPGELLAAADRLESGE
jgi:hypothetical protein